jgi:hypothetical protein
MYRSRYESLFNIPRTDYKSWAHQLQKLGYATDPNYAQKLIRLIERHELYKFDNQAFDIIPDQMMRFELPENYQRNDMSVEDEK